jgi:hypothetical protein
MLNPADRLPLSECPTCRCLHAVAYGLTIAAEYLPMKGLQGQHEAVYPNIDRIAYFDRVYRLMRIRS